MRLDFDEFIIEPIHEKYAWRICDLCTTNSERFKRFFPKTLKQNLTPTLSTYFVEEKLRQFVKREEFLFVLKEIENRTVIGLVYIKELNWNTQQGELAYCIGYKYESKGYTTKSVQALSHYAFEELGLKSIQIIVHKTNTASVRVAEKCGYIWQKTLLKAYKPPAEKPLDMELYVLENEG